LIKDGLQLLPECVKDVAGHDYDKNIGSKQVNNIIKIDLISKSYFSASHCWLGKTVVHSAHTTKTLTKTKI